MKKRNDVKTEKPGAPTAEAPVPIQREAPGLEYLPVQYTMAERLDLAEQLARAAQSSQDLDDQKKANDAEYKEASEAVKLALKRLTRKLTQGNEMRNVNCKWLLEFPTSREKTLVRLDTGEQVRVMPMQDHDFQEELPITEAAGEPLVLEPPPTNGSEPVHAL
ncbi:MAG: hypothetical protein ACREMY_12095 [bacterium]